jgi:hypothetical protein
MNEQKAKTKTILFRSKGAAVWPQKIRRQFPAVFHGRAASLPHLCRFCPHLARQRMAASLPPFVLTAVRLDALNTNLY